MDPSSNSTDALNTTSLSFVVTGQERHTNTRNEIGELPTELLVNIFSQASGLCGRYHVDTRSSEPYVPRLQIMAQVCRRWREIINGAPELWTFVTDKDRANIIMVLDRSRAHPIGLSFRDQPIDKSLYATVLNHSHRWVRASIEVDRHDQEVLRRLEEVDVPMLQHLVLEIPALNRHSIFILDLFRDHPPQLTSLTLIEVAIRRWDSPVFGPRLHELKLIRIRTSGPTLETLRSILRACPELAHLELKMVALSNEINGLLLQAPIVQLPLLHTLVLKQLSPTDTIDILRTVETPHCRSYTISINSRNLDSTRFSRVTERIQQPFKACIYSCRTLEMRINDFCVQIICKSDQSLSSDFDLNFGCGDSNEQVLNWLKNMLLVRRPPLSPIPVDLHLEYSNISSSSPLPSHLHQLPDVRSLSITCLHGWIHHLVEALSIPRDAEQGYTVWMWPSMREVIVKTFDGPSPALLHMVETRMKAALLRRGPGGTGEIVMLERLGIGEEVFTLEDFGAVRAVIRDVIVVAPPTRSSSARTLQAFFQSLLAAQMT
ncbi:hypothetical protein FRB95_004868 [Tulasnella sp. JGI-2019a]|nr:hypothetical protein FRB93_005209 [Tulasnella sp. JGI-2019a]KAG9029816.1 hypothetical protein FRB95_004868 [Tulasnella sp. JGI-2019a]